MKFKYTNTIIIDVPENIDPEVVINNLHEYKYKELVVERHEVIEKVEEEE